MVINIDLSAMNEKPKIKPTSSQQKKQPSFQNQSRKKGRSSLKPESDPELLEKIYGLLQTVHENQQDIVSSLKLLEKSNTVLYNNLFKNDTNVFLEEANPSRDPFAPNISNHTQGFPSQFLGFDLSQVVQKSIKE
jgi:hypothetical protein